MFGGGYDLCVVVLVMIPHYDRFFLLPLHRDVLVALPFVLVLFLPAVFFFFQNMTCPFILRPPQVDEIATSTARTTLASSAMRRGSPQV